MTEQRTIETHIAFLREVMSLHDRAGSNGGALLDPSRARGVLAEVDELESALRGLLTFRDDKDHWNRLSDAEVKEALDVAFQRARWVLHGR